MEKNPKSKKYRMTFAERLAGKLLALGDIDTGVLSDRSAAWVSVRVKDLCFAFTFDAKGEKITRLGLYKDVWEKTGEKQIASFNDPKEYPTESK